MEVDNSTLFEEIQAIARAPAEEVHGLWELEFIVNDSRVPTFRVVSIEVERDYVGGISDEITVSVMMPEGDYLYDIVPFQRNLKAVLLRTPAGSKSRTPLTSGSPTSEVFNCTLEDVDDSTITNTGTSTESKESANRQSLVTKRVQLVPAALEDYMEREINAIFRKQTVEEVLKTVLMTNVTAAGQSVAPYTPDEVLSGRLTGLAGVDIVTPTNQKRYEHIVIPPGVRLADLPQYLQKKYGVYDSGIGFYLQGGIWYVFPVHDTTRFQNNERTVTIGNIPAGRITGSDRTFSKKAFKLSILATNRVTFADVSEREQLNYGNGYRLLRGSKVMNDMETTSRDVTTLVRKNNVIETVIEGRANGKNHAPFAEVVISDNTFVENSLLSKRIGSHALIEWENSVSEYITPGMPSKFLFQKNNRVIALNGVVHSVVTQINVDAPGMVDPHYNSTSAIRIYMDRNKEA